jgi:hypothetical protein
MLTAKFAKENRKVRRVMIYLLCDLRVYILGVLCGKINF